jgi:hypothetical protein
VTLLFGCRIWSFGRFFCCLLSLCQFGIAMFCVLSGCICCWPCGFVHVDLCYIYIKVAVVFRLEFLASELAFSVFEIVFQSDFHSGVMEFW